MKTQVTISMQPDTEQQIRDFCKKKDVPLSSVFRRGALELIERESVNES